MNYRSLKKCHNRLKKSYQEISNSYFELKEKEWTIIGEISDLKRDYEILKIEHCALNEMLYGNKLYKKIKEYEILLQTFSKLDFEKLLFLISNSNFYKDNIISILINKIKYGKKDLADQEKECAENILNFNIMECNEYVLKCIAGLPQKKSEVLILPDLNITKYIDYALNKRTKN